MHFVGVSVINLNVRCYFKGRNRRSSAALRFLRTLTKSYAFKRLNYEITVLSVNTRRGEPWIYKKITTYGLINVN